MEWHALLRKDRPLEPVPLREPVALDQIPTPALLLDEAQFERNLQFMAEFLRERGKAPRPHAKMHKTPAVARKQMALGAVGICAAKVAEAEVMADAGLREILITSPVATDDKLQRIVQLSKRCGGGVWTVVDDHDVARRLAVLAERAGTVVGVLVDIDPDMGRTGVRGAEGVLRLVEQVHKLQALRYHGLQQYAGHVMHIKGHSERKARSIQFWERAAEIKMLVEAQVAPVTVLTGGGTGTYDIDSELPYVTDLQVGSYAFMDEEYLQIGGQHGDRFDDFPAALFVLATAISQPRSGSITLDAGYKSFAAETVAPVAGDFPGTRFRFAGDEHGVLQFGGDNAPPKLGERVKLIASHCDPTVNLYDWIFPYRDGLVREIWPVAARGCSW